MLLVAEVLILITIAMVIIQFFLKPQEEHRLLQGLATTDEDLIEDYLKVQKSNLNPLKLISWINRPIIPSRMKERLNSNLLVCNINLSAEEFLLIQEICMAVMVFIMLAVAAAQHLPLAIISGLGFGYFLPRFWLSSKTSKIKNEVIKALPDTIDLLTLCVNAGLDFMLALKWVVEKSRPNKLTEELRNLMQEIGVGKSRRAALISLSQKYLVPDVASFTRSLIQADRMGTSVAQALEILSEDMRRRRFNRGEQQALKAPIKLLFPLLVFIFPVVGIIVAGPILLQFMGTKGVLGGIGG